MPNASFLDTIDQLSDEALFNLLTLERGLYRKEAIVHAETIFQKRGLELKSLQKNSKSTNKKLVSEVKNRLKYGESVQTIFNHFNDRGIAFSQTILDEANERLRIENNIDRSRKLFVYLLVTAIFIAASVSHLMAGSLYRTLMGIFFATLSTSMLIIIYRLLKRKISIYSLDTVQSEK